MENALLTARYRHLLATWTHSACDPALLHVPRHNLPRHVSLENGAAPNMFWDLSTQKNGWWWICKAMAQRKNIKKSSKNMLPIVWVNLCRKVRRCFIVSQVCPDRLQCSCRLQRVPAAWSPGKQTAKRDEESTGWVPIVRRVDVWLPNSVKFLNV